MFRQGFYCVVHDCFLLVLWHPIKVLTEFVSMATQLRSVTRWFEVRQCPAVERSKAHHVLL